MRRPLALAALLLAPRLARADIEIPLPPPVDEAGCPEGQDCGPAPGVTASPPEGGRFYAPEARLGLWLLQEASIERTSHFSPGLRFAVWAGEHLELDAGYQFAYDRLGTERLYVTNTVHALDLRAHFRYPLRLVALTGGLGVAGYLTTISAHDGEQSDGVRAAFNWGLPFALGVETWAAGHPVRFEGQLATRGPRLDLLFAATAGY